MSRWRVLWLWVLFCAPLAASRSHGSQWMDDFGISSFQRTMNRSIERLRNVWSNEKAPILFGDAQHSYNDKYSMIEASASTALAAQLNVLLIGLGMTIEQLQE